MFGFGGKRDEDENDGAEPSQVDLFSQALEQLAAFSAPEPEEKKPDPVLPKSTKPVIASTSSTMTKTVNPSINNAATSTVTSQPKAGYTLSRDGIQIQQEIPKQFQTEFLNFSNSDNKPKVTQVSMLSGKSNNSPMIRTVAKPITVVPQISQDSSLSINQVRLVKDPVTGQMKKIVTVNRSQLHNLQMQQRGSGSSSPILMSQPKVILNNGFPKLPSVPTPVVQPLTKKDVSRLWLNDDIKFKEVRGLTPPSGSTEQVPIEEEVEAEEDELGVSETYSDYMPTKLKVGFKHPDPVVETSSLSSVEPPDVRYRVSIPESVIDNCQLSALQLEAITYACQQHETFLPNGDRAGYLIGDGAGVGKGRTVAGVIYENYLQGRKRAIWLSVSNDLRCDAERDLSDIGAGRISVQPLNKLKYAKISSKINNSIKKGVIFATYSSLIGESQSGGKYGTRLKQLLHWCGEDFDGVIIFDECHRAKNLCPTGSSKPTKTGLKVLELQNRLPKARIVYASATGASEPKNMAYMVRLGLWGEGTPFRELNDFLQAVERRGVGAMELVAMDMKLRGMYIARQLSFHGVTFRIEEVPVPKEFTQVYNEAVNVWVEAKQSFQTAANMIDAEPGMRKNMWGQFWSAHQRFFKYLCISAKVPHLVKLAREAVKNGKCVVIGLQSTGEARTLEQLEEMGGELNDFVSTAKGVLQTLVEKHFPAPTRNKFLDLFLGGPSLFDDLDIPSPGSGVKRKAASELKKQSAKRFREVDESSNGNGFGSSSSDESEDSSDDLESDSDDSESEVDDEFNPFGAGSDSDDSDPWLKKSEKKPKVKKAKIKKEKKKKGKKKKKEKKVKDEDEEFDTQLKAAGLMGPSYQDENSRSSLIGLSGTVNNTRPSDGLTEEEARQKAMDMKQDLLDKIDRLGDKLPPNALDEIIDLLGGPDNVAEMTGRKGRVVSTDDGVQYESRREFDVPLEILNLTEKQRFMDGEKDIAIISEAASSGISLQADRRVRNQKRRVHITLELPWSADRAIQQFGRTHRSNQVSAPEYVFMISELAGERRFAATVAKRLESLGALTHGDRRATDSRDLSQFNIDNKFGRAALESVMKSVIEMESPLVPPPTNYKGNFFEDLRTALIGVGMLAAEEHFVLPSLEKDYNNISKFLNRILGMKVELQNKLFKYFTDVLAAIILQAKRDGKWDMGILDLGAGGENVKIIKAINFVGSQASGTAKTTLYTVGVERGLSWDQAMDIWREHTGREDGFYTSRQVRNEKLAVILAVAMTGSKNKKIFTIYRPNTGQQPKTESLESLRRKYKKVIPDIAQEYWDEQYSSSAVQCSHVFWHGSCKRIVIGLPCEVGLRSRTFYVLCGSVLSVWSKVESVLALMPSGIHSKMQIVRLRTDEGKRIVGSIIPANCVDPLMNVLSGKNTDESKPLLQPFQQRPPSLFGPSSRNSSFSSFGPSSRNSSSSSLVSAFGMMDMPQF